MPTPIEVLLDPVSLILFSIYLFFICLEVIRPARPLKKIKGWVPKTLLAYTVYFFLSTYLPLLWEQYLIPYRLLNLENTAPFLSVIFAVFIFELLLYIWHRTIHSNNFLWRVFHQMHHSAERIDTLGAFYFSPFDMIGFTFLGSLTLSLVVGIPPQAISYYLYITIFLVIFQHANLTTPRWLGYIIQRPESHSIHHQKGVHAYNYSDLPIIDMLFGTFKNPHTFASAIGFYDGASYKTKELLLCRSITKNT